MATDFDAPRAKIDDSDEVPLVELPVLRPGDAVLDVDDDGEVVEPLLLPDADLSAEELTARVIPKQNDEFICSRCFLVQHRRRLAAGGRGGDVCADCA